MGTEDWVLKGTKLITNTRNQKLKIQSRVWNFKNTMLKKRRRKRKRKKKSQKLKKNIGTKLITNTKKQKLKIQSRVWNFRNTMLKKRRKRKSEKKSHKNYIYKKYRYEIDDKYQKAKIKNLEQRLVFQKYNIKEKKKKSQKL